MPRTTSNTIDDDDVSDFDDDDFEDVLAERNDGEEIAGAMRRYAPLSNEATMDDYKARVTELDLKCQKLEDHLRKAVMNVNRLQNALSAPVSSGKRRSKAAIIEQAPKGLGDIVDVLQDRAKEYVHHYQPIVPPQALFAEPLLTRPDVDIMDPRRAEDPDLEFKARRAELYDLFEADEKIRTYIGRVDWVYHTFCKAFSKERSHVLHQGRSDLGLVATEYANLLKMSKESLRADPQAKRLRGNDAEPCGEMLYTPGHEHDRRYIFRPPWIALLTRARLFGTGSISGKPIERSKGMKWKHHILPGTLVFSVAIGRHLLSGDRAFGDSINHEAASFTFMNTLRDGWQRPAAISLILDIHKTVYAGVDKNLPPVVNTVGLPVRVGGFGDDLPEDEPDLPPPPTSSHSGGDTVTGQSHPETPAVTPGVAPSASSIQSSVSHRIPQPIHSPIAPLLMTVAHAAVPPPAPDSLSAAAPTVTVPIAPTAAYSSPPIAGPSHSQELPEAATLQVGIATLNLESSDTGPAKKVAKAKRGRGQAKAAGTRRSTRNTISETDCACNTSNLIINVTKRYCSWLE